MYEIEFPDGSRGTCDDVKMYNVGDFGRERRASVVIGEVKAHAGDEVHHKVMELRNEVVDLTYAEALAIVLHNPENADLKVRFAQEGCHGSELVKDSQQRAGVQVHELTQRMMREKGIMSYSHALDAVLSAPENAALRRRYSVEG